jgi:ABC-type polysaccharide/polyol phosphate export permease
MQFVESLRLWELWSTLGWKDVRRRYRRTLLGPFWLTMSMALLIATLGTLSSELFRASFHKMIPYVSAGIISWAFIAALANDGCTAFTQAESTIKQVRFPYLVCMFRVIWRNTILYFHNLVLQLIVIIGFGVPINWTILLFIPGLLLVLANASWFIVLVGVLCTRFRDITQVVASLTTVLMFITPVFWLPEHTTRVRPFFVEYNIFYHLLEILRQPLLGNAPELKSYAFAALSACIGWPIASFFFRRYQKLIPLWL